MTVRECLEFSAKLKLPGTTAEKIAKVDEIIMDLKLNKCQDTFIGGTLIKGVSGGERKRTSIGVELITNPSLIFLDEPTTGLDSYTATQVMVILRNLANAGRTIIQTIH
jgi:ABC-type multidrug transport system ATPase subunit